MHSAHHVTVTFLQLFALFCVCSQCELLELILLYYRNTEHKHEDILKLIAHFKVILFYMLQVLFHSVFFQFMRFSTSFELSCDCNFLYTRSILSQWRSLFAFQQYNQTSESQRKIKHKNNQQTQRANLRLSLRELRYSTNLNIVIKEELVRNETMKTHW